MQAYPIIAHGGRTEQKPPPKGKKAKVFKEKRKSRENGTWKMKGNLQM